MNPLKALREHLERKQEAQRREQEEWEKRLFASYERCNAANEYLNILERFPGSKAEYEEMRKVELEYFQLPRPTQRVLFAYGSTYDNPQERAWSVDPFIAGILKSAGVVALVEIRHMGGNMCMGRPVRPKSGSIDDKVSERTSFPNEDET
jgi:hypothetical protein